MAAKKDNKKATVYKYEIMLKDGNIIYRDNLDEDAIKSYEGRGHKVKKVGA